MNTPARCAQCTRPQLAHASDVSEELLQPNHVPYRVSLLAAHDAYTLAPPTLHRLTRGPHLLILPPLRLDLTTALPSWLRHESFSGSCLLQNRNLSNPWSLMMVSFVLLSRHPCIFTLTPYFPTSKDVSLVAYENSSGNREIYRRHQSCEISCAPKLDFCRGASNEIVRSVEPRSVLDRWSNFGGHASMMCTPILSLR